MAVTVVPTERTGGVGTLVQTLTAMRSEKARRVHEKWERETKGPYLEALTTYNTAVANRLADTRLRDLEEQLKALQVSQSKTAVKMARKKFSTLRSMLKGDESQQAMARDVLTGYDSTKMLKAQLDIQNQTIAALGAQLNAARFGLQQTSMDLDMMKTLFVDPDAMKVLKESMGDEAFGDVQADVASKLFNQKLKRTPHDYGTWAFSKVPRKLLDFNTALRYWKHGNIDDTSMWGDWSEELQLLGYELKNNKIIMSGKTMKTPGGFEY